MTHFFHRSEMVQTHTDGSLVLDSAARGGVVGLAGAVAQRAEQLASDPVEQAAQLGGTGITVADAHSAAIGATGCIGGVSTVMGTDPVLSLIHI